MSFFSFDPIAWAVFGAGGVLLGGAGLLLARLKGGARLLWLAPASVLLLLSVAAVASAQPDWLWQPLLALAAVDGVLALLRFRRVAGPALQSGAVLLVCAALLGWQLYRLDQAVENDLRQSDALLCDFERLDLVPSPSYHAQTDRGTAVPLFTAAPEQEPVATEKEDKYLQNLRLDRKLIQTGSADPTYNCHGWVFTGGRCWVRGGAVDSILADNGYRVTTNPREGDVVVFRNSAGEVMHTGLVRGHSDGSVLIESKWGQLGRYVHTAEDHAYREHARTYYRTARGSHLVAGLEGAKADGPAGPTSAPGSVGRH
jgi:hypothetical protein